MRKNLFIALLVASISFFLSIVGTHTAYAAFDANNIMDDAVFDSSNSMTEAQIQAFLNGFPSSCIKNYSSYEPINYFTFTGSVSAAHIIKVTADMWGISPKVLLATLEKESSLVSGGAGCATWRFNSAMGYNCPDSGGLYDYPSIGVYGTCVGKLSDAGFSRQVNHAGWLLKFSKERAYNNLAWDNDSDVYYYGYFTTGYRQRVAGGASSYYDGWYSIDGQSTYMSNGATAALYTYTPHYSGNQSFTTIYERWFGSTRSGVAYVQVQGNAAQYLIYNGTKQLITYDGLLAWGINTKLPLTNVTQSYLDTIPWAATPLTAYSKIDGTNTIVFADGGKFYDINQVSVDVWGGFKNASLSTIGWPLLSVTNFGGSLPFFVTKNNDSNKYVMEGGTLYPLSNAATVAVWGGTQFINISDNYASGLPIGAPIAQNLVSTGGQRYYLDGLVARKVSAKVAALLPWQPVPVTAATMARYTILPDLDPIIYTPADSTRYIFDKGMRRPLSASTLSGSLRPTGTSETLISSPAASLLATGASVNSPYLTSETSGELFLANQTLLPIPDRLKNEYSISSPTIVSDALLGIYTRSTNTLTQFVKSSSSPTIYFVSEGHRIPFHRSDALMLLNGQNMVTSMDEALLSSLPIVDYGMTPVLTTASRSEYLINDKTSLYTTADTSLLHRWNITDPVVVSSATYGWYKTSATRIASLGDNIQIEDGRYCRVDHQRYCAASTNPVVANWGLMTTPFYPSNDLLAYLALNDTGAPSVFVSGHAGETYANNVFIMIDKKLYYVPTPSMLVNLGYSGQLTRLSDSAINSLKLDDVLNGYLFKDSSAVTWVIDGHVRRKVPATYQANWASTTIQPLSVTSAFLNLYLQGPDLTWSITGTAPGAIYAMSDGQKHGITSYARYLQSWSPYSIVSNTLLTLIPDGALY